MMHAILLYGALCCTVTVAAGCWLTSANDECEQEPASLDAAQAHLESLQHE